MKIIKEIDIGVRGCSRYYVEMPAERRVAFLSDYPEKRYDMVPVDLPLPPMLYRLQGPNKNSTSPQRCSMEAAWGLEELGGEKLFSLPLLNYSHYDGTFSICVNTAIAPPSKDLSLEDVLSGIISFGWATPMRYQTGTGRPWEWLGAGGRNRNWPEAYKKWESLTLEEACEYPWGKQQFSFDKKTLLANRYA